MLIIKPFKALRPDPEYVSKTYINHGDGGDSSKYKPILDSNPHSMLHVSHADLALSEEDAKDNSKVRNKAQEILTDFLNSGVLVRDETECFYIYRLSMANHSQTGLVACVDIKDYLEGDIKRHELTRVDKVQTQANIIDRMGGNLEPILLVYDSNLFQKKLIEEWAFSHDSTYDILDSGGTRHEFWVVSDEGLINALKKKSEGIDALYICDGHHRIEATAAYYKENPTPETQFFLSVIFPSEEMLILDYNRAVKDLNGMTDDEFLKALEGAEFKVEVLGPDPEYPREPGEYTMVMNDIWYRLKYMGERNEDDPVARLDVSILQEKVLRDLLGIENPQADNRLSFISGTKGLEALQTSTHKGMKVAFAICPPEMSDIMDVADADKIMPPKSTYFEPKPVGGMVIYHYMLSSED